MADQTHSNPPPPEVIVEFLRSLQETVNDYDHMVPVLRGSTLLQHWFGSAARPAADIDLEWFPQPGRSDRISTPLEHARRLCMHTVSNHAYYGESSPIRFDEDVPVPSDGLNLTLWEYDTPGARCYAGWRWDDRQLTGCLQVDLAQAGSYDLAAVAPERIEFAREWGEPAQVLAYTQEMLLAAKLSWIIRSVQRSKAAQGGDGLAFRGQVKDLFDAHLLVTQGTIRPDVFQNAFLAVAIEDQLDWNLLDALFDPAMALPQVSEFADWTEFLQRHKSLVQQTPVEMLGAIVTRIRPLISDVREHLPFLRSLQDRPLDEANFLIYADWLEERADPRGNFLRLFCQSFFQEDREARGLVTAAFATQPSGWLYHVFGSPDRSRDLRQRLEFGNDPFQKWIRPATEPANSEPTAATERPWWRFW